MESFYFLITNIELKRKLYDDVTNLTEKVRGLEETINSVNIPEETKAILIEELGIALSMLAEAERKKKYLDDLGRGRI